MKLRSLAPHLLGLAVLAAGCAGNGTAADIPDGGTSSGTSTGSSVSPSETSSATSPTVAASPVIEDGRNFAFVKSVDASADPVTVTYDLAYFLTGEDAVQAAKDHGDEAPPPNDYYIVNDNPRLRTVPLAADARLVLLDWSHCCDRTFDGSLADFARALHEGEVTVDGHIYKGRLSPYWLIARDGLIVRIEEQYLP
jgi:hypothetical protein